MASISSSQPKPLHAPRQHLPTQSLCERLMNSRLVQAAAAISIIYLGSELLRSESNQEAESLIALGARGIVSSVSALTISLGAAAQVARESFLSASRSL